MKGIEVDFMWKRTDKDGMIRRILFFLVFINFILNFVLNYAYFLQISYCCR